MVSLRVDVERSLGKTAGVVLAITVIANSGYMLMVAVGSISSYLTLALVAVAIMSLNGLVLTIREKGAAGCRFRINFLVIFSVLILTSALINGESPFGYVHFIAMLIIGCYLSIKVPLQSFIRVTGSCMCVIVIISLVFIGYISCFGIPAPFSMVNTSVSVVDYYNFGIFFYPLRIVEGLARNQAIFWEPGLFAGFSIMSLCLEIAFRDKPSIAKISILIVGVFSSSSSSGIALLILLGIVAVERFASKTKAKIVVECVLLLLFIIALSSFSEILGLLTALSPEVFGKLSGNEMTKVTRLSAPVANIAIFFHDPIFGAGLHGANEAFISLKSSYGIDSQTSTSTYLVAAFGMAGIAVNVLCIVALARLTSIHAMQKILVGVLFLLLLNVEPYGELAYVWILFFYLLGQSSLEDKSAEGAARYRKVFLEGERT